MSNGLDKVLFFLLPPLVVFIVTWIAKRLGKSYGTQVIYQFVALCLLFAVNFYSAVSSTFGVFIIFSPISFFYYLLVFVFGMLTAEFIDERHK